MIMFHVNLQGCKASNFWQGRHKVTVILTFGILLMDKIRRENQLGHDIVYPIIYRDLCITGDFSTPFFC